MFKTDEDYLRAAIEVARLARKHGNHPFGAILVNDKGEIVLKAENTVTSEQDCTAHAETNLMRLACKKLAPEELARCTLYTSTEPCAMCAGAMYWGNLGRVVYGLSARNLTALSASGVEIPALDMPCRELFSRGQRSVQVVGPLLEEEAYQVHEGFWES